MGSSSSIVNENYMYISYSSSCKENNGDDNERFGIWANGILTETAPKNIKYKKLKIKHI